MGPVRSMKAMEAGSVLVVDDDPKILELVRAYLRRAGYAVVTAGGGRDALRENETVPPKLGGLAVMLPPVGRFGLVRHLRGQGHNLHLLMQFPRRTVRAL